jgi:Fur family ferric uptake transcriptional regulator
VSPAPSNTSRPGDEFLVAFRSFLRREGLKSTRQRELIVREFAVVPDHVSVEELLQRVRVIEPGLGYATVYRTLKLMVGAGLAGVRNFGEGFARYEPLGEDHHDHLICENCGRIVEFHDEELERRQDRIAAGLGYRVTHHRHELFGICANCLRSGVDPEAVSSLAPNPKIPGDALPAAFRRYLGRHRLRVTRQRMAIVETFSKIEDHVSVDDLLARVRLEDSTVGYATVYRTLKLLVDAGLAADRQFGDGFTRFEPRSEEHHDHFVDEEAGKVLEFHDSRIEARQEEIAREHGFRLTRHRHDLFGLPLATTGKGQS